MKQFDYERAWHELAKPAYEALPQNVRDLFARTAAFAENRAQKQLSAEEVAKILDFISEFPYPYELKCADGRKLKGGQS